MGASGLLTYARCRFSQLPLNWPVDVWSPLDFSVLDPASVDAQVIVGSNWRWHAGRDSVVQLLCSLQIQRVPGEPLWQLRVQRGTTSEEVLIDVRGYTAQIAWVGRLGPQDTLHVEIRPRPGPAVLWDGGSSSSIVIAGYQTP